MGQIEFGLILPENPARPPARERYLEDLNRLLVAAKGAFASTWCIDHLQGDVLDGWTTISYLSALHPEMSWGNTVLSQTFRNPALVAKMGATLHFLTGGRFVLGIGAGGDPADHVAYGYGFPPPGVRVAQLDEALHIIQLMWTQDRATFAGEHYRIEDAACAPRPVPVPPIMVGAFGPKMLRLVARHADWWNVSSTGIAAYSGYVEQLERACDEVGRDPATLRRVWSGGCTCAPTEAEVQRLAAGWPQDNDHDFDFAGTPARVVEQMRPFIDLGVDCFLLDCGGFPRLTTVETLARDVLPMLDG
jgi:alkanesulfonate monooxygenase SsuD/methylene tetrahydromethanopterin reductase-like flavin-dependent oxidoreductase (luciferase family)